MQNEPNFMRFWPKNNDSSQKTKPKQSQTYTAWATWDIFISVFSEPALSLSKGVMWL
jgi:hypothetical protein